VAFLNWRFGLTKDDRLEDRGGARPRFVERGYPTKAITIPITLYMDMGMVMIREKGVPRDAAMGGSMGVQARQSPSL
jgi:hypothetical protein